MGPIQVQHVDRRFLRQANRRLRTLPKRIVTDYMLPKVRPRNNPYHLRSIRQVPFIPLSQLPPAVLRLQAALNSPLFAYNGPTIGTPRPKPLIHRMKQAVYKPFFGGG